MLIRIECVKFKRSEFDKRLGKKLENRPEFQVKFQDKVS